MLNYVLIQSINFNVHLLQYLNLIIRSNLIVIIILTYNNLQIKINSKNKAILKVLRMIVIQSFLNWIIFVQILKIKLKKKRI